MLTVSEMSCAVQTVRCRLADVAMHATLKTSSVGCDRGRWIGLSITKGRLPKSQYCSATILPSSHQMLDASTAEDPLQAKTHTIVSRVDTCPAPESRPDQLQGLPPIVPCPRAATGIYSPSGRTLRPSSPPLPPRRPTPLPPPLPPPRRCQLRSRVTTPSLPPSPKTTASSPCFPLSQSRKSQPAAHQPRPGAHATSSISGGPMSPFQPPSLPHAVASSAAPSPTLFSPPC